MTNTELKEYVSRAKELEAAVYTQKKLMDGHKIILDKDYPVQPVKKGVEPPKEPARPVKSNEMPALAIVLLIFGAGAFILSVAASFALGIIGGLAFVFFGICGLSVNANSSKEYKEGCERYRNAMERYQSDIEKYSKEKEKYELCYQKEMQEYKIKHDNYASKKATAIGKHNDALRTLTNALADHYSQEIIFPKYRNFVAITAIDEYLSSGRCDRLEGADGAYNLYEMELRQNIVIGQLAAIVDNLEKIKNNQYSLYQELSKANETVGEILSEVRGINDNTRLTAYFAEVTAIAATAPRYTISV